MNDTDNSTSHEEPLWAVPTDYRALLAMTRPLVIGRHTVPFSSEEEVSGSGFRAGPAMSTESDDARAEFSLKKGEIFRPDTSGLEVTQDGASGVTRREAKTGGGAEVEDAAALISPPQGRSNLKLRIYLGMS